MRKIILTHLSDRPGQLFEFEGNLLRVGRGDWNELIFAESTHGMVSRSHAEITRQNDSYALTDNNSSTGTYVNGDRISRVILKSNDVIQFGKGGPQVKVDIPTSHLKATVIVPPLQDAPPVAPKSPGPSVAPLPAVAGLPLQEAPSSKMSETVAAPQRELLPDAKAVIAESPAQPVAVPRIEKPAPIMPPRPLLVPAPAISDGGMSSVPAGDLCRLQSQLRKLMVVGGICFGVILVLTLIAVVRVSRTATQIGEHTQRLDKLDAVTGELLQKISNLDPKDMQRAMQQKVRELDQKAREFERRAQDIERKFEARFEQKSREVDAQFELLGQAYPQVRSKMEEIRRRRGR